MLGGTMNKYWKWTKNGSALHNTTESQTGTQILDMTNDFISNPKSAMAQMESHRNTRRGSSREFSGKFLHHSHCLIMTRKAICKQEMKMSWTLFHGLQMSTMLQLKGLLVRKVSMVFEKTGTIWFKCHKCLLWDNSKLLKAPESSWTLL